MPKITKPKVREIINDFADEIKERKRPSTPPRTAVINFRNEKAEGIERQVYFVPIKLLRYRKDNGRISSDIMHYEKINGYLDETDSNGQETISRFLEEKDKEKTEDLKGSIKHSGQDEPAIITCDGFLINGNRRKLVMEKLLKEYPGEEKYKYMKVVILPGKDNEDKTGGPPTLLEIEQIENRYQLQIEAKADYYGFDKALSIRRKDQIGMSLKEQMRDDPVFASLSDSEFKKEYRRMKKEYLGTLICIDRYLDNLDRSGLYGAVSRSIGDSEGRWQAFLDYNKFVYSKITDDKSRMKLGLSNNDIGKVEDVAFKIMRKRHIKDFPKLHKIMRDLPKYFSNEDSKNELFKLLDIDDFLIEEESIDNEGNELNEREIDKIWGNKNEEKIIRHLKNAKKHYDIDKTKETPIQLLEDALNKLNHKDLIPKNIKQYECSKALKLLDLIKKRAKDLSKEFYECEKNFKKLLNK